LASRAFIAADDLGILESPEEVLTTLDRDGNRRWIYPEPVSGKYTSARFWLGWALIGIFVFLPVVRIGGKPAVFLDLLRREFTFFGATFYPTDTFLLLLMMIGLLLSLLLITALLGRVWCGWGCPQTVYMEFVYRPIERWLEGKEHIRKRRDQGPANWDKVWRKSAKWAIYGVISLFLAHTFVAYFAGWHNLIYWMQQPPTSHWGYFLLMSGTTALILFDFGVFREQMCTITCPYARIQSVLLDQDSLIVSYDPTRGEPRGKRGKKALADEASGAIRPLGDCVDCYACVRTCPTGIDIRDGLQMECIACTQCIDACDSIMDRIGKPAGLIRYTSENELAGQRTRRLRPRTFVYSALITVISITFITMIATANKVDITVGRSVGLPFTELPDGSIANRLRFRVHNQSADALSVTIRAAYPESAIVRIVGTATQQLDARERRVIEAWVSIDPADVPTGRTTGHFVLEFSDGAEREVVFELLGPTPSPVP
jgi:cytochrome c oxidase accessory protein FixG